MTGLSARYGLGLIAILTLVLGCRGSNEEAAKRNESNLKPLAILYSKYRVSHRGQAPANEKAFKEYISTIPEEQRKRFHAEDVDALFISPRDNKPYRIIYKDTARRGQSDVVAYEQEGAGGKRWVARDLGIVDEVDEARFKELVPDGP